MQDHDERVVDEFSRQAELFAAAPEMNDEEALRLLLEASEVTGADDVLDIACGPGIVGCAFASVARQVTGVDLTPAMIQKARELEKERALSNVSWFVGNGAHLELDDDSFSVVVSRYAFHHLGDPVAVLREAGRVLKPGGRLVVADVTPPAEMASAFNVLERLRDPSHVQARSSAEFVRLFEEAGFEAKVASRYRVDFELEQILAASSAPDEDKEAIRSRVRASLVRDHCGMRPRLEGDIVRVSYPITVFVARRARSD